VNDAKAREKTPAAVASLSKKRGGGLAFWGAMGLGKISKAKKKKKDLTVTPREESAKVCAVLPLIKWEERSPK